jgi:hypothetical protein
MSMVDQEERIPMTREEREAAFAEIHAIHRQFERDSGRQDDAASSVIFGVCASLMALGWAALMIVLVGGLPIHWAWPLALMIVPGVVLALTRARASRDERGGL